MFKDVMGNEIEVCDYVIYFDANRNATVKPIYCTVVGFTPKKVRIRFITWAGQDSQLVESTSTKLIVVNDLVMTMPIEKMKETFAKLEQD